MNRVYEPCPTTLYSATQSHCSVLSCDMFMVLPVLIMLKESQDFVATAGVVRQDAPVQKVFEEFIIRM